MVLLYIVGGIRRRIRRRIKKQHSEHQNRQCVLFISLSPVSFFLLSEHMPDLAAKIAHSMMKGVGLTRGKCHHSTPRKKVSHVRTTSNVDMEHVFRCTTPPLNTASAKRSTPRKTARSRASTSEPANLSFFYFKYFSGCSLLLPLFWGGLLSVSSFA